MLKTAGTCEARGGGGVLPYKGLWGRAASHGMFFGIFVLNRVSNLSFFVLNRISFLGRYINSKNFYKLLLINIRVKCLKQGIKNRNSVFNRVGKSAIFVLNRIRV